MSFVRDCREAAKFCPDRLLEKLLKDRADELSVALGVLTTKQTVLAMQNVNAAWVRAQKALDAVHLAMPPTPTGGSMEVPERTAA